MEPALQTIAAEFEGKAKIVKVDADASPDLFKKYGVEGIPALVLLKDGEEVSRLVGLEATEAKTKEIIQGAL